MQCLAANAGSLWADADGAMNVGANVSKQHLYLYNEATHW